MKLIPESGYSHSTKFALIFLESIKEISGKNVLLITMTTCSSARPMLAKHMNVANAKISSLLNMVLGSVLPVFVFLPDSKLGVECDGNGAVPRKLLVRLGTCWRQ